MTGYTITPCEVMERVFAGRQPLNHEDAAVLAELGITHVLDLRQPLEWDMPWHDGCAALEAMRRLGIQRRNQPVPDGDAPTCADLDAACGYLAEVLENPQARIYVHCRAGIERTGTVLAAWYARFYGLSCDAALRKLKLRRASLCPLSHQIEAVQRWLGE